MKLRDPDRPARYPHTKRDDAKYRGQSGPVASRISEDHQGLRRFQDHRTVLPSQQVTRSGRVEGLHVEPQHARFALLGVARGL